MLDGSRTESVSTIRYTSGGSLSVTNLSTDADDTIELIAGSNLYQNAGKVSAGRVEANAGQDLIMAPESTTSAQNTIAYRAGETLAVSELETSVRLDGGRIVLDAPSLASTAETSGEVDGAFAWVKTSSGQADTLEYMFGEPAEATRIMLNGRMAGGELAERNGHFLNSLRTSTGQVQTRQSERRAASVTSEEPNIDFNRQGEAANGFSDS